MPETPQEPPLDTTLHQAVFQLLHTPALQTQRPHFDTYFMALAALVATRSPCSRQKVGCVFVSNKTPTNRVLTTGYNGFLQGHPHLSRIRNQHEQATVHAEQNAIASAARHNVSLENAKAYITHFPCVHCVKMMLASGIAQLFYHHHYHDDPIALELIEESGAKLKQL